MGSTLSVFEQSFPPKPTWGANDIPDLTGKVALVTGAFSSNKQMRASAQRVVCP